MVLIFRHIQILIFLSLSLFFTSCLSLKQHIRIDDDNRGVFKLKLSVSNDLYEQIKSSAYADYFDKNKANKLFSEKNGFETYDYSVSQLDDKHEIEILADIIDLDKAIKSGQLGAFKLKRDKDGNELYYSFKFLNDRQKKIEPKLLEGIDLRLEVKVKKIILSNAHKIEGKTAIWQFDQKNILKPKSQQIFIKYSN